MCIRDSFYYYINPIHLNKKVDRFWDIEAQRAGVTLNAPFFKPERQHNCMLISVLTAIFDTLWTILGYVSNMKDKYAFLEVYEGIYWLSDVIWARNVSFFKWNTNNVPPVHFFGYFKNNYYLFQCIFQHNDEKCFFILIFTILWHFFVCFFTLEKTVFSAIC